MTHLLIFILLSLWQHRSIDKISRYNLARKEAEAAYTAGNFTVAADRYAYLNRAGSDGAVKLNAAHAYFQLNQYGQARQQYEAILQQDDAHLASVAAVQLGVIACYERDSATALTLFRQALLQDPDNEPARYNYELIQKQYSGKAPKKKPSMAQKRADQQQVSQQLKLDQTTVDQSDKQDEKLKRFSDLNMTEEEALKLLDAMQGNDLPYASLRPFRGGRSGSSSASRTKNRW